MQPVDSKQVRAEIAANGFAEAVERHGFRKVGATHWRRDNDEVTWRVALVDAGYKLSPGCFLAVMGALVHGLDDIAKKVDGKPLSSPIRGLSARAHVHRDVGGNTSDGYFSGDLDPFDDDLPEPIRHSEFMRRKYRGLRVQDSFELMDLKQKGLIVKHWGEAGYESTTCAFLVHDRDVREVADVVACYFETYFIDEIDHWSSFRNIYQDFWGPAARFRIPYYYKDNFCAAWMAGDQEHINDMAKAVFQEAARPEEDYFDRLIAEQSAQRTGHKPQSFLRHVVAKNQRKGCLRNAREIVQICEAIGATYPHHQLEFSDIGRLENEAREFEEANKKLVRDALR